VGKLATEQTTLPPVGCSDARAALSAGSKAGSGFLICWKIVGIRFNSDVMTDLVQLVSTLFSGVIVDLYVLGFVGVNEETLA
jgi:hypothetical protein